VSELWSDLRDAWWKVGPTWATIFDQFVYQPEPAVLIGDVDFTSSVISDVTITRGRDSVYVEPSASYASVLLRSVGQPLQLDIGAELVITLNSATGVRESLFRGVISDVEVQVVAGQTPVSGYRVTAVGPLADASRRDVLRRGRGVELDGQRARAALFASLTPPWEVQPLDLLWDDADGSWDDLTGDVAVDQFDDGVYLLAPLEAAAGGHPSLLVAQEAASSGGGVVYENRFGKVAYAASDRRAQTFADSDFFPVEGDVLDVDGMSASSSLAELSNRVIVEWADGVEEGEIRDSIIQRGVLARTFETILASSTGARTRAQELALLLSEPVFKTDQFRLLLNNVDLPLLDRIVRAEPNDGVEFVGLPATLGFTSLQAFVEGIEWRIDPFTVGVGLFASDERLSVGPIYWARVPDDVTWDDVDVQLEWQNVGRTL